VDAGVLQVAAVVVLVVVWFVADGFARTKRRQSTKRARSVRVRPVVERSEVLDGNALSASDD